MSRIPLTECLFIRGQTALHVATQTGQLDAVRLLLARNDVNVNVVETLPGNHHEGQAVNATHYPDGKTPLIHVRD